MSHAYTGGRLAIWMSLAIPLALAACSNAPLPSLTTGSLFGSKPDTKAAAAAPEIRNDPTARALYVGRVAAKSQRCGFNFDPVKLKGNFIAKEAAQGIDVAELSKLDKAYTSAFNGTIKAAATDEAYCSEARTTHIKADLNRHLAGDYAPGTPFKDPNAEEDGGLFAGSGGLLDGNAGTSTFKSPTMSTNNL